MYICYIVHTLALFKTVILYFAKKKRKNTRCSELTWTDCNLSRVLIDDSDLVREAVFLHDAGCSLGHGLEHLHRAQGLLSEGIFFNST